MAQGIWRMRKRQNAKYRIEITAKSNCALIRKRATLSEDPTVPSQSLGSYLISPNNVSEYINRIVHGDGHESNILETITVRFIVENKKVHSWHDVHHGEIPQPRRD
jgi:hypothetical protein